MRRQRTCAVHIKHDKQHVSRNLRPRPAQCGARAPAQHMNAGHPAGKQRYNALDAVSLVQDDAPPAHLCSTQKYDESDNQHCEALMQ
jgi:hypothetical protein